MIREAAAAIWQPAAIAARVFNYIGCFGNVVDLVVSGGRDIRCNVDGKFFASLELNKR